MATSLAPAFVPPHPRVPDGNRSWYRVMRDVRSNALGLWTAAAYQDDFVIQHFFGRQRILINEPETIHHILIDNTANYRRSPATIRILRPIVGEGLFLSEGEDWKHQRRTIAPALAPRVIPMLCRHIVDATEELLPRLRAEAGRPVDLLAAMQFLALEIAGRSMFSLEMRQHGAAMRALIAQFAVRLGRPYLLDMLLPPSIPTLQDLARRRFRKRWLVLMDEIIKAREAAPVGETPRDLFDLLRAARDPETGAAFSHEQLRDQIATMIVAGHETTAVALFWSLFLLASAPGEQEQVAAEVRGVDLSADNAVEALAKLPYTKAVLNEALRLYPPAFLIIRQAIADDRCGSLDIPRGSLAMIAPWVLHRHRKLWRDPDAFMPSRFLDGGAAVNKLAYLPFGAGPRVCVGAQFALAEATLVLAALVKNFRIALADTTPVMPVAVVTTQPSPPARFRLELR
jgi:cytochrome P450